MSGSPQARFSCDAVALLPDGWALCIFLCAIYRFNAVVLYGGRLLRYAGLVVLLFFIFSACEPADTASPAPTPEGQTSGPRATPPSTRAVSPVVSPTPTVVVELAKSDVAGPAGNISEPGFPAAGTPSATSALVPVATPLPLPTPVPTATPVPTPTPVPTATPRPTPTPTLAPTPTTVPPGVAGCGGPGQVDINSASTDALDMIVHIGPARAAQIVSLRPFSSVDDLIRVKGIGPQRLADIKAQGIACVNG